jgi:hypothetical protein
MQVDSTMVPALPDDLLVQTTPHADEGLTHDLLVQTTPHADEGLPVDATGETVKIWYKNEGHDDVDLMQCDGDHASAFGLAVAKELWTPEERMRYLWAGESKDSHSGKNLTRPGLNYGDKLWSRNSTQNLTSHLFLPGPPSTNLEWTSSRMNASR